MFQLLILISSTGLEPENKYSLLVYNVQLLIKSLARPGRKQARKHVRDARDFNNIETRTVIKSFYFLQGKAPKEIHKECTCCYVLASALYCALIWNAHTKVQDILCC